MNRLGTFGLISLGTAVLFVLIGGLFVSVVFLGPIANKILANAVGPEDRELPPTAYPIRSSSGDVQNLGGLGEGLNCSLPWGVNTLAFWGRRGAAPISLQMRQACVFHDYCYRHGSATYGYTQADCDYILQEQAFRLCTQINSNKSIPDCETSARKVTLGVRLGGAGRFRRADALDPQKRSTYFEFDPYPVRSPEFTAVRVADTPMAWVQMGAARRAVYAFTVRRSGVHLKVIAVRPQNQGLCASFDLPGEYRWLTIPPLVSRHPKSGDDWLVWWRRSNLENTAVLFSGIAPRQATLEDWVAVFGKLTNRPYSGCSDDFFADAIQERAQTPPRFVNIQVANRFGAPGDPLVSEFHTSVSPNIEGTDPEKLHLFGLTTHGCGVNDVSTCVAHVQIDPVRGVGTSEPFRTLDPKCLRKNHPLFDEARSAEQGDCDRYRDFASHPSVIVHNGVVGMAWLRRGQGNDDDYQTRAILRWAPAKDPAKKHDDVTPKLKNYIDVTLDGLGEEREPAGWINLSNGELALFAATRERDCGKVRFSKTVVREPHGSNGNQRVITFCHDSVDASWLGRPYHIVNGDEVVMLKTTVDTTEFRANISPARRTAKINLEILSASLQTMSPDVRKQVMGPVLVLKACDVSRGDAKWTISEETCPETKRVRYGRARKSDELLPLVVRAINTARIVVAHVEDDSLPSVLILNPISSSKVTWIKSTRTAHGLTWQVTSK